MSYISVSDNNLPVCASSGASASLQASRNKGIFAECPFHVLTRWLTPSADSHFPTPFPVNVPFSDLKASAAQIYISLHWGS
jgi:hypothetical protein